MAGTPPPRRSSLLALAAYLGISFLYFGVPIAAHPGRDYVGEGFDPQIFIWSFAWWPHAIGNGLNPIMSDVVWAPTGVNLAWVTSVPGLALALAPVTVLAGPVVAYNLAALLMPALAAFTAFLLCRHLTGSFWPSLAGGYLFGFSSYMLGQTEGHLHMSAVFLVPLAALLLVRFFEGTLGRRALALWLGLLLAAQLSFSTELAFTLSLALVVAVVATFALVPSLRPRVRRLAAPLVGAYALAVLLASPLLVSALADFEHESFNDPEFFSGDLLNLVVPTRLTAVAGSWSSYVSDRFAANDAENGLYLGLPLLAIVVWFGWRNRRDPIARLLVVLISLGILAALGTALRVRGAQYAPLPWKFLDDVTLLNNVLPVRFGLYVWLGVAVVAALWASGTATAAWIRIALTTAAVAAVVPHLWLGAWHVEPTRPVFFTAGHDRDCLAPGENVLMLPHPAWSGSTLWQAQAGFRFRMADGALNPLPPEKLAADRALLDALAENQLPAGGARAVVDFARRQGATTIVLDGAEARPWRDALSAAGLEPDWVGGMYVYRLSGQAPSGCGS